MVRPFEVFDPIFKDAVVVESIADIQDEIIIGVLCLEVISDILNVISVEFFNLFGSGKGHSDESLRDVGEIKSFVLEGDHSFRASHKLFDQF